MHLDTPFSFLYIQPTHEKFLAILFSRHRKKPLLAGVKGGPDRAKILGPIEKHHVPDDIRNWAAVASGLNQWGKQKVT
jgi:hypothetical protein